MLTHRLYFLASIFWALLLGPLVAMAVVAFSAGLGWLYVFGDNSWPEASSKVIFLLGLASGLLVAAAVIWTGYKVGRQKIGAANPAFERRRAIALLALPLFLAVLTGLYFWNEARNFREAMKIAVLREALFAELVSEIHKIVEVSIELDADEILRARVRTSGTREGEYQLSWKVSDTGFSRALLNGDESLSLRAGVNEANISFSLEQLRLQYRVTVLRGIGGALVDEPFRFEVVQKPVLTLREQAMLPPGERVRLSVGESPLKSARSTTFPVQFFIP